MNSVCSICVLLVYAGIFSRSFGHKILVFPLTEGYTSSVTDVVNLGRILKDSGHEVHYLMADILRDVIDDPDEVVHLYRSPEVAVNYQEPKFVAHYYDRGIFSAARTYSHFSMAIVQYCDHMLAQEEFMRMLSDQTYDLFLFDHLEQCGSIIADFLKIPTIIFFPASYFSSDAAMFPAFPALVPEGTSSLDLEMNFMQRAQSFIEYASLSFVMVTCLQWPLASIAAKYNMTYDPHLSLRSLVVSRSDFGLDYPRPLLPNIINIAGIFAKEPNPLPDDFEKFVSGAAETGIIVVSFGSMVKYLPYNVASEMAKAFASLPQRVIWRYESHITALGNNTMIWDWIPQNDLLGHPLTRAFVTHCGLGGTLEAVHHAVPVVAIPLILDQYQNADKLCNRAKMGIQLQFGSFAAKDLQDALQEVIENPVYKTNARKTRDLVFDQSQPVKEKFLFYVDYVVRHEGIEHLIIPQLTTLSWVQVHSLDVCAIAAIGIALLVPICVVIMKTLMRYTTKVRVRLEKRHQE